MKVKWRLIMKKTGCTRKQAKYLATEIKKLPKLQDQIMEHLDEVNLYNCDKVELVRLYNYMDSSCNINGYRPDERISYKDMTVYKLYRHTFHDFDKDRVFKSVI